MDTKELATDNEQAQAETAPDAQQEAAPPDTGRQATDTAAAATDPAEPPVAPEGTDPQAQTETAHLDKPGVEHPQAGNSSGVVHSDAKKQVAEGAVALISKGGDQIPVQVKDGAHLDRLIAEHGAANVKVAS